MSTHTTNRQAGLQTPCAVSDQILQTEAVIVALRRLLTRCAKRGISFQDCYLIAYDEYARNLSRPRHAKNRHA